MKSDWKERGWDRGSFKGYVVLRVGDCLRLETSRKKGQATPTLIVTPYPGNVGHLDLRAAEDLVAALHNWRSMMQGTEHAGTPLNSRLQVVQDFLAERGITADELALLWCKAKEGR